MIERNYDGMVNRWMKCVQRGHHTFVGDSDKCFECGADKRGQQVVVHGGPGIPQQRGQQIVLRGGLKRRDRR